MTEKTALDVWFKFENEDDEEPILEANTFEDEYGQYRIEWYHNDIGYVNTEYFDTYSDAEKWYEENGFIEFTA